MFGKRKSRHDYYIYHDGPYIFARRLDQPRVLAETCEDPQAAHDKVQSIINPHGLKQEAFGPLGFHSEAFLSAISGYCKEYVEAAYARVNPPQE